MDCVPPKRQPCNYGKNRGNLIRQFCEAASPVAESYLTKNMDGDQKRWQKLEKMTEKLQPYRFAERVKATGIR
jgi:hypothetical protein